MTIVVDASLAIAWVFDDEGPPPLDVLRRIQNEGAIVPSLWRLEVANVMRTAVLQGRYSEKFVSNSLTDLARLPIVVDPDTDRHAWGQTRTLSRAYGITVYDAAYLELALRREIPLASCDIQLIKAARRIRVEVLAP